MPLALPIVRAAAPSDAEPVAAIFAHYVTTSVATFEEVAPAAADWRRRLDDLTARNLPVLVAADGDGSVCGFAYASPWRPKPAYRHTVEDTVYLSPGHTGRGLGSALLGGLLAGCADAGARQVIAVIADTGSEASAALHRRFGFTQAGRLAGVGRKHGRWIDTVLMQKDLAQAVVQAAGDRVLAVDVEPDRGHALRRGLFLGQPAVTAAAEFLVDLDAGRLGE